MGGAKNFVENILPSGGLFGAPGESTSSPTEISGVIGRPEAQFYSRLAGLMLGVDPNHFGKQFASNPFIKNFMGGNAGGFDPATQDLLNNVMSASQGRFNALGIGASPGAQYNIAASAAPTLSDYRTRKIQELLQLAGLGVPQVGQTSSGTTAAPGILSPIDIGFNFGGGGVKG